MNLDDALRTRRTVRRFRPDMPPRALVERCLAAAILAPSASNKQPWRFFVVTARPRIAHMAGAVREAVDRVAAHVEPAWASSFRAYGDYFTRFEAAPVVIACLHRGLQVLSHMVGDRLPAQERSAIAAMERDSGLIGVAMAMENLLLAAHDAGLGASGMTGPLLASGALREILEVPGSWELAALVALGYPDEEPAAPARKGIDKVVRWL